MSGRVLTNIAALLILGGAAFVWREPLLVFAQQAVGEVAPCRIAISYTVGSIDERFGISRESLQEALDDAEDVWESETNRELFTAKRTGAVIEVNLVYDRRQETTEQLREIGETIEGSTREYEALKARHRTLLAEFQTKRDAFERARLSFEKRVSAYEAEVHSWNRKGGAPPAEAARLNAERDAIEAEQTRVLSLQKTANAAADAANAQVRELNAMAAELNDTAARYNTVGGTSGEEFEEAVYESVPGKATITVYEYDSTESLTRVLAHEFGHALGLDHVENKDSIMYRLNQSTNMRLTEEDTAELASVCSVSLE